MRLWDLLVSGMRVHGWEASWRIGILHQGKPWSCREAVSPESMRLKPIAVAILLESLADTTIADTQIGDRAGSLHSVSPCIPVAVAFSTRLLEQNPRCRAPSCEIARSFICLTRRRFHSCVVNRFISVSSYSSRRHAPARGNCSRRSRATARAAPRRQGARAVNDGPARGVRLALLPLPPRSSGGLVRQEKVAVETEEVVGA